MQITFYTVFLQNINWLHLNVGTVMVMLQLHNVLCKCLEEWTDFITRALHWQSGMLFVAYELSGRQFVPATQWSLYCCLSGSYNMAIVVDCNIMPVLCTHAVPLLLQFH